MAFTAEAVRAELTGTVKDTVRASPGETVKARLRAAARFLGLPTGRVQDYWHGEVRRIEAHEADQIRHRAAEAKRHRAARLYAEYMALRAELLQEAPASLVALVPPAIPAEVEAAAVAMERRA